MFALDARGEVNVYLSADKFKENAGLVVGNCFWNTELLAVQKLWMEGKVDSIKIHVFDYSTATWQDPIDLHSKDAGDLCLNEENGLST